MVLQRKAEFLVLGADPERVAWLATTGKIGGQLVEMFDGGTFAALVIRAAHAKAPIAEQTAPNNLCVKYGGGGH